VFKTDPNPQLNKTTALAKQTYSMINNAVNPDKTINM